MRDVAGRARRHYHGDMPKKIESTVRNAAADLAKARLPGRSRVTMVVLDEQDEARIDELRRAISNAETTEEIDGDRAFAEVRASMARKHHHRP